MKNDYFKRTSENIGNYCTRKDFQVLLSMKVSQNNTVFRNLLKMYDGAFSRKYLPAIKILEKSSIVDIWQDAK